MTAPGAPRPGRRILFVAYHFPPSAAVGGRRVANFATSARSFGWEPHVLTIADEDVEQLDRGLLSGVEGIPVDKARVGRSAIAAAGGAWRWLRHRNTAASGAVGGRPAQAANPERQPQTRSGFRRFVLSLLALPDWERTWVVPATRHGLRPPPGAHRLVLATSCPPYSVHLVGFALKKLSGRRWVADFRDPWMTTGSKRLYPTSALSMHRRALERKVIEAADVVVFNVDRLRNAYRESHDGAREQVRLHPERIGRRSISTYRGPIRCSRLRIRALCDKSGARRSRSLAAVAELVRSGRIPASDIRIRLIGHCDAIDGVATGTVVAKHGLESIVEVQKSVPPQRRSTLSGAVTWPCCWPRIFRIKYRRRSTTILPPALGSLRLRRRVARRTC